MTTVGLLSGLGEGLAAAALGAGKGRLAGEREGFRRQQLQQQRADKLEQNRAGIEFKRAQLEAMRERDRERLDVQKERTAAQREREIRSTAGRIAHEMVRWRRNPEYAGFFAGRPDLAREYDAHIDRALGVAAGTIPFDQFDEERYSQIGEAIRQPELGAPVDAGNGHFSVTTPDQRTVTAPDFPTLGAAVDTPNGGSFIPSAPGAAAPNPLLFETPKQREARLKREGTQPKNDALTELALSRAGQIRTQTGELPKENRSKQLLRDRQGRSAITRAGAAVTTSGAAAERAKTDKARLEEQKRAALVKEADQERRTNIASLRAAQNGVMTRERVTALQMKMAKATGQMSDIDRRRWQIYAKQAIRTKRGKGGLSVSVDPVALAELDKLAAKYGSAPLTSPTMVKPAPVGVDADDWRDVTRLIDEGQFAAFLGRIPADHPRRIEAKRIWKLYQGTEYNPSPSRSGR